MSEQNFPPIDLAFLKALEAEFPDIGPALGADPGRERERAGQLHVVRWLRAEYEDQQKE